MNGFALRRDSYLGKPADRGAPLQVRAGGCQSSSCVGVRGSEHSRRSAGTSAPAGLGRQRAPNRLPANRARRLIRPIPISPHIGGRVCETGIPVRHERVHPCRFQVRRLGPRRRCSAPALPSRLRSAPGPRGLRTPWRAAGPRFTLAGHPRDSRELGPRRCAHRPVCQADARVASRVPVDQSSPIPAGSPPPPRGTPCSPIS